jgi:hypothetical protein
VDDAGIAMNALRPTVTLCNNATCGRRHQCYRSVMLPLYANVYGQHVTDFHFDLRECRNFLHSDPVKREEEARRWREEREREARDRAADELAREEARIAAEEAEAARRAARPQNDLFSTNVVPMRARVAATERKKRLNGGTY